MVPKSGETEMAKAARAAVEMMRLGCERPSLMAAE
jgi:hypothetical protein